MWLNPVSSDNRNFLFRSRVAFSHWSSTGTVSHSVSVLLSLPVSARTGTAGTSDRGNESHAILHHGSKVRGRPCRKLRAQRLRTGGEVSVCITPLGFITVKTQLYGVGSIKIRKVVGEKNTNKRNK